MSGEPIGWRPSHCIFCGQKPRTKSKEHFIPRWLSIDSGRDDLPAIFDTRGGIKAIKLSQITAPACESCNEGMSALEGRTKVIFRNLRSGYIKSDDIMDLLDWLDKLRTSLWLYMLSAWKDRHDIRPRFSVNDRIRKSDRIASISLLPDPHSVGIGVVGNTTDFFLSTPTVFGLLFRDIAILSWSEVSALGNFFGLTRRIPASIENGHPGIGVQAHDKIVIPNKFGISRIPSVEVFSFAKETSLFHPDLPVDAPMILANGQITEMPTVLDIPRSSSEKSLARDLFVLSVYEQQKRSSSVYADIHADDKQRAVFKYEQVELDSFIDDALKNVNERTLFPYHRTVPPTL